MADRVIKFGRRISITLTESELYVLSGVLEGYLAIANREAATEGVLEITRDIQDKVTEAKKKMESGSR